MKFKISNFPSFAGWLSVILNIILFLFKYWVGLITGSVALIADAWHTLSDTLSSGVFLVGLHIAKKPADKEHPFGHGRAEQITSIIIGVLLALVAGNFLIESIQKLQNHDETHYTTFAIVVTIISLLVKEFMARYSIHIGKEHGSDSLVADGLHHRSDAVTSAVILAGIFLGDYFWWIDGILGLIVSGFIGYSAWSIMIKPMSFLLGFRPNEKLLQQIKEIAFLVSGRNVFLHHIHIHHYGYHKELTCHILLPGEMTLHDAHEISTNIEMAINKKLNMETTIHIEPDDRKNLMEEF